MRQQRSKTAGRFLATVAIAAWAAVAAAAQPPSADAYSPCREQLASGHRDYDSAYCFYQVTLDRRLWDEGARMFEELISRDPKNTWLVLAYGHVYLTRNPDRAEALYRRFVSRVPRSRRCRRRGGRPHQSRQRPSAQGTGRPGATGGRTGDRARCSVVRPAREGAGLDHRGRSSCSRPPETRRRIPALETGPGSATCRSAVSPRAVVAHRARCSGVPDRVASTKR